MTRAQKVLLVLFCVAGFTQVALAVYRGRILDEPIWFGAPIGLGIVVSGGLRVIADRIGPLQIVSATVGVLALLLGLWLLLGLSLSYGVVEGSVPISQLEKGGAAGTLLTFGTALAVSRRSERGRAFVACAFLLFFLALQLGLTLDARREASQPRTRGTYRMWH